MAPQKMTLAAMLLSLLVGIASGASLNGDETTDGFISKCLGQTSFEENSCQDRRRPALGHFYTCRLLGALESPPTRISKKGGDTFVAVEGNTLRMSDSGEGWNEANLAVIPEREAMDRYNNRYYADGGTTYVTGERDSKATEIVTSGSYAFNEMALDDVNDLLFILPIDVRSGGTPSGSLYAVQTNRLVKDAAGKIRALKLDQFQDHFTALHIPKNSTSILLGVSELETGKLLELNFNKYDPCTPGMEKRDHFSKTIAEASESLVKIFDEAMKTNTVGPSRQRTALADNGELQRLRAELRASETKLERYTRQISTFTGGLKKVQTQSQNMDKVTGVAHIIGGSSCKQDVESLQSRVDLLEGILSGTIALLDGMSANATAQLVTDAPELLLRSGLTVDVTTEAESQETDEEYRARLAKYFGEPTMI